MADVPFEFNFFCSKEHQTLQVAYLQEAVIVIHLGETVLVDLSEYGELIKVPEENHCWNLTMTVIEQTGSLLLEQIDQSVYNITADLQQTGTFYVDITFEDTWVQ